MAKKKPGNPVPRLRLISKRGTRVYSYGECSNCHNGSSAMWRYAESSKGTVHICGTCKPDVQDFSYGKVDAFAVSPIGGGWAPNSQRKR